ncbi:MAG: PAS domain-containing protein [Alphaproteobacteria bacterium]|nr:PAS domain-containing protein [Alphaproteobacteria bacterium]
MTSTNDNTEFDLVFSETGESHAPDTRRLVTRSALLSLVVVVIAAIFVYWVLDNRERQLLGDLKQRTEIMSSTRAEVLETWLGALGSSGQRLSRSDLFRLFAAEIALTGDLPAQNTPLAAQAPYMIQAVTEYVRQEGLIGAYMVDAKGRAVLASGGAPALNQDQRAAAMAVYKTRTRRVTPARMSRRGLVVDVILPVAPPQEKNPAAPTSVAGVFVFTIPVQAALGKILSPSPLQEAGEVTRLVQVVGDKRSVLDTKTKPALAPVKWRVALTTETILPFGPRMSVGSGQRVFSSGAWVAGVPWMVVHEINAGVALAPLRNYFWGVASFALVITVLLVAMFTAFWWRQASEHSQELAGQYLELGKRINAQRHFLESLMGTLTEMVGLKNNSGSYVYVNPSFADAVDRSQDEITGLDDSEVFGRGTAQALERTDQQARDAEKPVTTEETIHFPSGAKHLQFTKVPYQEEDGSVTGILSVARDVTELREAEEKRQAAFNQMTRALVRTIETVDPFLAGHTQHVHEVGLALSHIMGLDSSQVATIDITAQLAQIGKVSVPKEIVAKTDRLTPQEIEIMKSHVNHAVDILKGVDFGIPVVETLAQCYERLDGSGYPKALKGDEIGLLARLLGVADVFCARIESRSYRDPITAAEALKVFLDNQDKYDERVVAALKEFLSTVAGEKFVAQVQGG